MSGNSYGSTCPNCGENMSSYSDHKPFEMTTHDCHHCGFYTEVKVGYLSLDAVNENRAELELEELKELPKQEFNF
jgi:hypothetical protein